MPGSEEEVDRVILLYLPWHSITSYFSTSSAPSPATPPQNRAAPTSCMSPPSPPRPPLASARESPPRSTASPPSPRPPSPPTTRRQPRSSGWQPSGMGSPSPPASRPGPERVPYPARCARLRWRSAAIPPPRPRLARPASQYPNPGRAGQYSLPAHPPVTASVLPPSPAYCSHRPHPHRWLRLHKSAAESPVRDRPRLPSL